MKTLSEKQFSSDSSTHQSHESTVFFHDKKIESETDSLSRETCSVWFLYWILDRQKKSDKQVF